MAIAVEVAPRRDARLDRVRQADRRRHIFESSVVLPVQTVRATAEADELVEVAVVVEVGPRVGLAAVGGKEIRLDELEVWAADRWRECGERQGGDNCDG